MGALTDSAGILFRIKSANETSADFAKVTGDITKLGATAETTGGGFAAMAGPAAIAAAAIAAIGAAAIGAATALFDLTKRSSEYGSELFDAKIRTGLTAEAISALGFAAKISGSSLETVSGAVSKFNVLVGEGAQGNEKAEKVLAKYNVTARDTTEAFTQAIATIGNMTKADEKAVAARELFKDRTSQMLPIVDQLDGKFKDYIKTAERLGVTLTEQDLKAADEFGDTLDLLGEQAKIVGVKFAAELMPKITGAMQEISRWMSDNQGKAREWGDAIVNTITGIQVSMQTLADYVPVFFGALGHNMAVNRNEWGQWAENAISAVGRVMIAITTGGGSEIIRFFARVGAEANKVTSIGDLRKGDDTNNIRTNPFQVPTGGGGGGAVRGGGGGGGGKSDAAQKAKQELQDQIQLEELSLKRLEKAYEATMRLLRDEFKETRDQGLFSEKSLEAEQKFTDGVVKIREELLTLQDKLNADSSDTKQRIALRKQWDEVKALSDRVLKNHEANNKALTDDDKKRAEETKKLLQEIADFAAKTSDEIHDHLVKNADADLAKAEQIYNDQITKGHLTKKQRLEALQELQRAQTIYYNSLTIEEDARFYNQKLDLEEWKKKKTEEVTKTIKDEEERKTALENVNFEYEHRLNLLKQIHDEEQKKTEEKTGVSVTPDKDYIFGLASSWESFKTSVLDDGPKIGEALSAIGSIATTAFQSFSQAIGSVVQNWVLLGTTGPGVMRKMVATVLAGVAAQSAVLAIFELAKGFAALFWNPPEAAAHFTSAALFGSIAIGTALAGRAIAGDAFKQQTQTATGNAGSNNSERSGNGGQSYSSNEDQVVEVGRNGTAARRGPLQVQIQLGLNSNGVLEVIKSNLGPGPFRAALQDAVL